MNPIDRVLKATAEELFGSGDPTATLKRLQRQVHPDLNQDRLKDATAAFVRLNELHTFFVSGSKPAEAGPAFTTRNGTWRVKGELWRSQGVRYMSLTDRTDTWIAYTSSQAVSGAFVRGHRNLDEVRRLLADRDASYGTNHSHFIPQVKDRFRIEGKNQEARVLSVNVSGTRWFPLSSFDSIDPKDIGWIARRVLIALLGLHSVGFLHGSPHLEAILIEPEQHGVVLKDWQYSVRFSDPLDLIDPQAREAYPTWAKDAGATKDGAMDLKVFGHAFEALSLRSKAPAWLTEFFTNLLLHPKDDAFEALEELTKLLDSHWERKFHKMAYPY